MTQRSPAVRDAVLVALCAATLLTLTSDTFLHLDPTQPPQEKRQLARFPAVPRSAAGLRAWPQGFETWLADNFGLRSTLLALNSRLKVQVLWVTPSPQAEVILGRHGWLYYSGGGELDYMLRRNPFTLAKLNALASSIEKQRQWLGSRGIHFMLVVAPNKEEIYPEHLPRWMKPPDLPSQLDQLLTALHDRTSVEVLDLRPTLRQAKQVHPVYFVTDTHWNFVGAHAAYLAIVERLAGHFPGIRPRSLASFSQTRLRVQGGDLATMLGVKPLMHEQFVQLSPRDGSWVQYVDATSFQERNKLPAGSKPRITELEGAEAPRAFVIHDSFGQRLQPFLSLHFSRAVYVFLETGFPAATIEREHPDVVIVELVERNFAAYPRQVPGKR